MKFTYDEKTNTYTLDTETRQVMLTGEEVAFIQEQLKIMNLRYDVEEAVKFMIEEEEIDISAYTDTEDALVDEVMIDLVDTMDCRDGEVPDENEIRDRIRDTLEYYEGNRW